MYVRILNILLVLVLFWFLFCFATIFQTHKSCCQTNFWWKQNKRGSFIDLKDTAADTSLRILTYTHVMSANSKHTQDNVSSLFSFFFFVHIFSSWMIFYEIIFQYTNLIIVTIIIINNIWINHQYNTNCV